MIKISLDIKGLEFEMTESCDDAKCVHTREFVYVHIHVHTC